MPYGRVRFYADENVEFPVVEYLRDRGYRVFYAPEIGFASRDDKFQLAEARRRKCVLLTKDDHFLNDRKFPFSQLPDTAIIVLKTPASLSDTNYGFLLLALIEHLGPSGNLNLAGMKIEVKGPRLLLRARVGGKIRSDEIDIRDYETERPLFEEKDRKA